jgi:hypothetical protein
MLPRIAEGWPPVTVQNAPESGGHRPAQVPLLRYISFQAFGRVLAVTDGLALLAAWAGFLLLLGILAFVVLRGDRGGPP